MLRLKWSLHVVSAAEFIRQVSSSGNIGVCVLVISGSACYGDVRGVILVELFQEKLSEEVARFGSDAAVRAGV